jgi:hypothetical protein
MTDEQVNRIVQHLCEQLHIAIRLKGTEVHPPNAKELGFDSASVRTVLLASLNLAGVTHQSRQEETGEEQPWPMYRAQDR